jgi:transcriptional regulator with XRE-family HTH domain
MTQDSTVVNVWQVKMHDLIGAGAAAARKSLRLTQEEMAGVYRGVGLTAYRTGTVGQLEAGLRRPRLDEVVLICAATGVSLNDLLPNTEERIDLGGGASGRVSGIRAVLDGTYGTSAYLRNQDPARIDDPDMTFPRDAQQAETRLAGRPEMERVNDLITPVRQYAKTLGRDDVKAAFMAPTDAERHAARRLSVDPAVVKIASRAMWDHRDFAAERDRRIGHAGLEPRSLQAKRGLATRSMLAELREYIDAANAAYGDGEENDGSEGA